MYDIRQIFAHNIKRLRKSRDLTQEEFAEVIGMQWKSVVNFESGRNLPNSKNLQKICDKLNVHPEEFFFDSETKKLSNKVEQINKTLYRMNEETVNTILKIALALK